MPRKTLISAFILLALSFGMRGQELSEYAGIITPYTYAKSPETKAPAGYKPFYISHYGRHGSRYHLGYLMKNFLPAEMIDAREAGALTEEGEDVLDEMLAVLQAHEGRDGDLSELGTSQVREIAGRLYKRWRGAFRYGGGEVRCRSSHIPRCILSMSATGTRLQQLDSRLNISYSTGPKIFRLLCHDYDPDGSKHAYLDSLESLRRPLLFDAEAFAGRLFKPGYIVKDPQQIAYCMYQLGAVEPGIGMGDRLFSFFTPEELKAQWVLHTERMYGIMGNSVELGADILPAARELLDDFISCADAAVEGKGPAADLRFGHDSGLIPLVELMGLGELDIRLPIIGSSEIWLPQDIIPCSANLQIVWYRKSGAPVLVKILYNEKETLIPALKTFQGPY